MQYEGRVLAGRFAIQQLAGHGGMSEVYRALDHATMTEVAVKVLRTDRPVVHGRLAREGRTLAALEHPAIARYVADGETPDGAPYVVMEWLEGEDLRQRLRRQALAYDETIALGVRIGGALGAAHARGIVHRDLKPSNVFLERGDVFAAKLFDFGLARWVDAEALGLTDLTTADAILGTPGYMSPEQARGVREADPRADVFALGCLLWACIVGDTPFAGESAIAVLGRVLFEDAPRLRDVRSDAPAPLDALLARMLSKEKEARPADGGEVAAELLAIQRASQPPRVRASSVGRRSALTESEQRIVCVVVASPARRGEAALHELRVEAERFGGRLEALASGALAVVVDGAAPATDQAAQATRCALALKALLPAAKMAVATGRGEVSQRVPVGEALDRAAALLEHATAGPDVRIDELTADLVRDRLAVDRDERGLAVSRERESGARRALLGRPTAFVGRDAELLTMRASYDECAASRASRALVVTGEPGVGKTRLVDELLRELRARVPAPLILAARGDPLSFASPFALVAGALRDEARVQEGEPLESQRSKLRSRVARAVDPREAPRVADFLGELAGVPSASARDELAAAHHDPTVMGDQMRRAWEDFLAAECGARPVVVVLEDLHWGDLPSVKLVDAALRALADLPLLVVAVGRPEVKDVFPHLFTGRRVTELRLGELARSACEALVRGALGEAAPAELVARAVLRGGGNAFCLEEVVRAFAAGKTDDLPATVLAIVEARLAQEDGFSRRVLRAASVFGARFTVGGVVALVGGASRRRDVEACLAELEARELVTPLRRPRFAGEAELAFGHALVREAAYATLTPEDRALGHKLAAEWLESRGEHDAAVLAEHFERGGEGARAVEQYRRAAEQALEGNDLATARDRAARGVACGAVGELRGALLLIQGEAHHFAGVLADAQRCALEAAASCRRGSAVWARAVERIVATSTMLGDARKAHAYVAELCQTWPDEPTDLHLIAASKALLPLLVARRFVLAESLLAFAAAAVAKLRAPPSPLVAAYLDRARAFWVMFHTGDLGEYRAVAEASLASFERAGALRQACLQRGYVGHACALLGQWEDAAAHLRASVAEADRMGLANVADAARHNLGYALARTQGGLAEARALEERAARAFEAIGDLRIAGNSRVYLSEIHALEGDAALAERAAREALALHVARELRPLALAALARALVLAGRPAEAVDAATEAERLLDELGAIEEGEAKVRLAVALARREAGDVEGARAAAARARDAVVAHAEKIADRALRASFLAAVPENARTLELARELSV